MNHRRRRYWDDRYWYFDDEFGFFEEKFFNEPAIPVSHNMDAPLMCINYTDNRFKPGAEYVIFGVKREKLEWIYSDRIWEWDRTRAEKANEVAQASGARIGSPRYYQEFLRAFYDKPNLELVCIMGGYNAYTMYAFYVYGFRTEGAKP